MALKGKKKSRVRGSQARRKPGAAPRPAYGTREKPRWYQTTAGLVIGFIVAVTSIVTVWLLVADSRNDAQALEDTQQGLQTYTTDLRTLFQNLTPIATEIQAAGVLKDEELPKKTRAWKNQLAEVQTSLAAVAAPVDLNALNGLVSQSLVLYGQSIDMYELLPDLEGETRVQVAAKATSSFQAANSLFGSVIQVLDGERAEADLPDSGLLPPATQAQTSGAEPGVPAEVEVPSGDEGNE